MFYFNSDETGKLISVTDEPAHNDNRSICRWNMKTFADAMHTADRANTLNDGNTYIATDAGSCVSPRYDVQRVPKVGEEVSYGFNGDYYPCGKIVSVGKGAKLIVKTSTGATFYRRKLTGSWIKEGGTWCLVMGTHNDKNPHF